jgi:RNA polymerase sigma-70 factor (ECF subfamily)
MLCPDVDFRDCSDEELMRLLADSHVSIKTRQWACDELVLRWYEDLKCYARRLFCPTLRGRSTDLADDIVQETFALVLEKAAQFDPSRRLAPWLRSVVHNLVVNLRRRESRYQGLGLEGDQLLDRRLPPLDDLASRELLARLSADEQDLLLAVYFRGEKVKEVAHRRGEPKGKIYRTLNHLKQRVRSALGPALQPCIAK